MASTRCCVHESGLALYVVATLKRGQVYRPGVRSLQ